MYRGASRSVMTWLPGAGLFSLWAVTRLLLVAGLHRLGGAGDGVMPLAYEWVQQIMHGESPYHDIGVAYPPLAMFFFAIAGLAADGAAAYGARFASAILAADFAGLCLAGRAQRIGRRHAGPVYVLGLFSIGPILLLWRYDLVPALFHLGAGFCLLRGNRRLSWALLGAGIALKPYLAVVAAVWGVWELRSALPSPLRRLAQGFWLALVPSLIGAVAMLPLSGLDFFRSYSFQASRGLQIESGPAILLAELGKAGFVFQRPVFSSACLCWERTGPQAGLIAAASTVAAVAGLAGLLFLLWRRTNEDNAVLASCAAVLITLVTYRVFSPQYLVWALAPMALVAGSRRGKAAAALVAGAALAAAYLYPLHYFEVINHSGAGRWLLLGRTAALLASVGFVIPPQSDKLLRKIPTFAG